MKKLVLSIMAFLFISSTAFAGLISEANNNGMKNSDIYIYLDVKKTLVFFKKNGIKSTDLLEAVAGDELDSKEKIFLANKILSYVDKLIVVGNIQKINKKKGILVYFKAKKIPSALKGLLKKLKSQKVLGKKVFLIGGKKGMSIVIIKNILVMGKFNTVSTYLKTRRLRKRHLHYEFKKIKRNLRKNQIYVYMKISKFLKKQLSSQMKKGSKKIKGLSDNVFLQSLTHISSTEMGVSLKKNIRYFTLLKADNRLNGKRLTMVTHFAIVGSSVAVSFFDMIAKGLMKKKVATPKKDIVRIQKFIGSIRTKEIRNGVKVSISLKKDEQKFLIKTIKKEIVKAKEKVKKQRLRKKIIKLNSLIEKGNLGKIKLFLANISDVNIGGLYGKTPLFVAAENNKIDIGKLLIKKGAAVDFRKHKSQMTPLMIAVLKNNVEFVKLLLSKNANIELKDYSKRTPLILAMSNNNIKIATLLIKNGADVNVSDRRGHSVLHLAVKLHDISLVSLVLSKGPYINKKDRSGKTALFVAASKGNLDIVKLLIEKGADPNITNYYGRKPADEAKKKGYNEVADYLNSLKK